MFLPLLLLCIAAQDAPPVDTGADAGPVTGLDAEPEAATPPPESVEDEILRNVLGQQIGPGTVADLALPEEYLGRVVDRVVRASFDERIGIVVPDEGASGPADANPDAMTPEESAGRGLAYGAGYAALALGFACWFALRARKGTA